MQFQRTIIFDVDLADPLPTSWTAEGYERAFVLVRWHGGTIATLSLAAPGGVLTADALRAAVAADPLATRAVAAAAVHRWLTGPGANSPGATLPSWSVVVCTRDRPDDLRRCLAALFALELPPGSPPGEIVIVDNAPSDDRSAAVVREAAAEWAPGAPALRYVRENRPGLNWARARGAREAAGEIVAYTDDDVVVDPAWVARLLEPFADSRVAVVTGLALPLELETEAQWLFERYGGFSRGLVRRQFDMSMLSPTDAGAVGAGANMAFRRALVVGRRLFDVELDAGTVTETGGDTYAVYLLLHAGYHAVYAPDALVWHRHRRDHAALRRTLYGYSVGGFAMLTRCLVAHGDRGALRSAVRWLRNDHLRLVARVLLRRPSALPRDLVAAYCRGVLVGPWAYLRSRARERHYRALDACAAPAALTLTSTEARG